MDVRTDPGRTRLAALDVARGLMIVVSVMVNAWFTAPAWFDHAPWVGVHPVDLVFPTFVTLSGAGLGMLYARRVRPLREARRVLVLVVAGIAYTALIHHLVRGSLDPGTLRWSGVLQLYAVVVLVLALLSPVMTAWWRWLAAAAVVSAGQTALLVASSTACGGLTPECNPSRDLDLALLGVHAYATGRLGHDPEGIVAILGALVTAMVGAAAGRLLRDGIPVGRGAAILGGAVLLGYLATAALVPTFKRLWTAPFAFSVAGVVVLVLFALHLLLDGRPVARGEELARYPLVALGRNSLLVYFGSHAVMEALQLRGPNGSATHPGSSSWAEIWSARIADAVGAPGSPWPFCIAAASAWTALAIVLHRLRVYVKA